MDLIYELNDGVAYIRFNRPQAMNAMSEQIRELFPQYLNRAEADGEVRAVVLTGVGKAFCSGADVKRLNEPEAQSRMEQNLLEEVEALRSFQESVILRLYHMPKPTMAAINGFAIGAGLSFAMACDFRVACQSARLSTGFGRIAVTGDTGLIWFLVRAIGRPASLAWLYTSEMKSAEDCAAMGVVTAVFGDAEFEQRTHELATSIASASPRAQAGIKRNAQLAMQVDLETALHQEALSIYTDLLSSDHREAVRALNEKRPPRFGS